MVIADGDAAAAHYLPRAIRLQILTRRASLLAGAGTSPFMPPIRNRRCRNAFSEAVSVAALIFPAQRIARDGRRRWHVAGRIPPRRARAADGFHKAIAGQIAERGDVLRRADRDRIPVGRVQAVEKRQWHFVIIAATGIAKSAAAIALQESPCHSSRAQ